MTRPASAATAANTALGGSPRATSVATRRKAACSSATRRSSSRASAFASAVAISSLNCSQTVLAARRHRPLRRPGRAHDPPQAALYEDRRRSRAAVAELAQLVARRARLPLVAVDARRSTRLQHTLDHPSGTGVQRSPTAVTSGSVASTATTVTTPSGSSRYRNVVSKSRIRLVSLVTASNTSPAGTPRATSVATRRSAVCSSATRRSSPRLRRSRWPLPRVE